YAIGDWIVLNDGVEVRVVETNWRSTHLLNGSNDLVVLPNSFLAKVGLTNLSSPDRSHGAHDLDDRRRPDRRHDPDR
ncbi:mechanosensitive ion channel domain-containing protein, partial [Rhizobium ruizarguesonis]